MLHAPMRPQHSNCGVAFAAPSTPTPQNATVRDTALTASRDDVQQPATLCNTFAGAASPRASECHTWQHSSDVAYALMPQNATLCNSRATSHTRPRPKMPHFATTTRPRCDTNSQPIFPKGQTATSPRRRKVKVRGKLKTASGRTPSTRSHYHARRSRTRQSRARAVSA
jgi:hypothetical protein